MIDKKYIITEEMIERIWRQFCRESPELVGQWVYEMRSNPISAHEATIAAKAREELTKEILSAFDREDQDGFANMTRAKRIIESLRSNPQEREGE
jgi:hypothetical protein